MRPFLLALTLTAIVAGQAGAQGLPIDPGDLPELPCFPPTSDVCRSERALKLDPGDHLTDVSLRERVWNEDRTRAGEDADPRDQLVTAEVLLGTTGDGFLELIAEVAHCQTLDILHSRCTTQGPGTAFARGEFFTELCIPLPGEAGCSSGPPSVAENVFLHIEFDFYATGQLIADKGGVARFAASARVDDAGVLDTIVSVSLGSVIPRTTNFLGVPVEVPELESETVLGRQELGVVVRRGQLYRFAISVAAKSESGGRANGTAGTYFEGPLRLFPDGVHDGAFEVRDVEFAAFTSSADDPQGDPDVRVAELETRVAALETRRLRSLGVQIEGIEQFVEARLASIEGALADLTTASEDAALALQTQIDGSDARLLELETELDALLDEIEALREKVEALRDRRGDRERRRRRGRDERRDEGGEDD